MARLGDIALIKQGTVKNTAGTVWLLNLDMVESESGNILEYQYVPTSNIGVSTCQFDTENVLYSKLRPYLNKVVLPDREGYASSELLPLRPNLNKISREYLTYYLRSPVFVSYISEKVAGAKMPRARTEDLLDANIPLPSLLEQRHITGVLDCITELASLRKQQLAKLDKLVKARFVEMFGDPVQNSKGFETKSGYNFFKLSNGKAVPDEKRKPAGIPAYGGNGISWYTDEILCKMDTLVVGRVGFQSGNVHLVKGPLWITDNAMYISEYRSDEYDLVFLCSLMEQIDFTRFQDAGDLKKVTQKPFMNMSYIKPPLAAQKEYVGFAMETDRLRLTIQQGLDKLEILKKALMQQYFG